MQKAKKRKRHLEEVQELEQCKEKEMLLKIANSIIQQLGPIHGRESFYQKAFFFELQCRGISAQIEAPYSVVYTTSSGTTVSVGNVFVDIVTDHFFIEFKNSLKITCNNLLQCEFYKKLIGKRGYLINFSTNKDVIIEVKQI